MSLASGISAGFTAIAAAVKTLTGRVDTLEGNPVIVEISQTAYDALDPPDANTLYVITS